MERTDVEAEPVDGGGSEVGGVNLYGDAQDSEEWYVIYSRRRF